MDTLHDSLDKLFTEVDHLDRIAGDEDITRDRLDLALSVAKRVRRESTIVVRALARLRDNPATAPGGTST